MEQVDKDETVVMIPVGALEQHGNQCPLGTDEIIAEGTARRIKEALDREIPDYPMLDVYKRQIAFLSMTYASANLPFAVYASTCTLSTVIAIISGVVL